MKRRSFLKNCSAIAAGAALARMKIAQAQEIGAANTVVVDSKPLFEISNLLYMQFMEPLGTTDSSVEASWSYDTDDWRRDFVQASQELAPDVMRYGGLFCRYYKWREGVGPVDKRPLMRNYIWGGKETNRVGTHEFADYCRRIKSEPLYCVNFRADGFQIYSQTREGDRSGDAREAADWVSYANDPENRERRAHGVKEPYGIKLWQLGNETNYGRGGFNLDEALAETIAFSRAMRARDPGVRLIAWGDNGWASRMVKEAGEHFEFIAAHMMGQTPVRKETVLNSLAYQQAPERAWEELMEMFPLRIERKLQALLAELDAAQSRHPIAITEGHLSLLPRNTNPILLEWLTGVYHARSMNLYQRHGHRVKIATAADFNGSRWTSNALMLQVPGGVSYLTPAGAVMRLFKRHNGKEALAVKSAPSQLDIAASRTGARIYLHVANMAYDRAIEVTFSAPGLTLKGGKVFEIAPENPRQAVTENQPAVFTPVEKPIPAGEVPRWRFPARSVSAVELEALG